MPKVGARAKVTGKLKSNRPLGDVAFVVALDQWFFAPKALFV